MDGWMLHHATVELTVLSLMVVMFHPIESEFFFTEVHIYNTLTWTTNIPISKSQGPAEPS